jgi:type II secretory pathway component GspD/PulD (secretin)
MRRRSIPRWRCRLESRLGLALVAVVFIAPAFAWAQQPEAPAKQPIPNQEAAEKPKTPARPVDERRLKFNFRFQRWADVLEWFARQSDLSLVLDAPPPGTFNYTDNREYTPAEAIDLLNGVLLSKGYTLLRRDRVLRVVNLADGLPADAVPRITLDEIDRRGKYEFVRVLFPLGKRSAEEVNKQIAPLLGPYGKSVPLVKTAQLLVTDTAGVMRAIHAIIESIPEPSGPAPIPPQLAVYPVKSANPATALEVLKSLLPDAKFALDSKTDQISALATPAEHQAIRATLEQLQPEKSGPDAPEFRFYPLAEPLPAGLISVLQTLAPKAQVTIDAARRRLMVLAAPADHTVIAATLDRFAQAAAPVEQRVIGVYPLKSADTASFLQLLDPALRQRARIVPDAKRDVLIVWAVAKDQQAIHKALDEFQKKLPGGQERESRVYRLRTIEPSAALAVLTPFLPAAQITIDAPNRGLIALATPADHRTIAATLEQLQPEKPGPDAPELRFYPLAEAPPANLLAALRSLAPKVQVRYDAPGRRLMALASPTDHQAIAATIERAEHAVAPPEQRVVAVYPLKSADTANFLQLLDPALRQRARIVPDAKRDVLIVWAAAKDQQAIHQALEEFQKKLPPSQEPVSRVYRFRAADPSTAVSALGALMPGAQMAVDPRTRSLVISAVPEDHAKTKSTIREIDREDSGGDSPVLKMHRIKTADPAAVLATLQSLFAARPEVRLSLDPKNDQVIALASPREHDTIGAVIAEVEKGIPAGSGAKLEVYPLGGADPANVLRVLNTLLVKNAAKVRLSVDASSRQLVAVAPPEEQAAIRSTIERLRAAEPTLEVFPLQVVEPFAAQTAIDKLFATEAGAKRPDAPKVESDAATQQLFVRATKEQLAQIRDLLVKMGETNLAKQRTGRSLRVIPFHGDAGAALSEIQRLWPQIRANPVRVVTPSAVLPDLQGRVPRQPKPAPPAAPSAPETKQSDR